MPGIWPERKPRAEKEDLQWKPTHEKFFSLHNLVWPPPEAEKYVAPGFCERQSEVVFAAVEVWPEIKVGRWMFFDTLMTMDRSFNFTSKQGRLRCPWQEYPPTFTGQSAVLGRRLNLEGTTTMKRIHPLEGFTLNGMGMDLWDFNPLSDPATVSFDDLTSMVGNMWSMFHFIPLLLVSAASVCYEDLPDEEAMDDSEEESNDEAESQSD